jgi:DNA-binding beta-propeller fold protein YncE
VLRETLLVAAAVVVGSTGGLGGIGVLPIEVAASAPAHLPGANGTLWVTDRTGALGRVKVFDAGTGTVIGTVTVGARPTGVLAPHGTDKVYVSNGSPGDSVSVISKDSLAVVATIATGAGSDPHHMAQSADGRFVFVALFGTRTVAVVDTSTDTVARTLVASANSSAKTHAVWVSNDGRTLYATNSLGSSSSSPPGTVSAIDLLTGLVSWELVVGQNPSEVLVTNNNKTAYVTVRTENVVKVLDLTTVPPLVSATVPIGSQPDTLQLTNDNKTLVVALRASPAATLMDTRSLETRTVAVAGTTTGHHWLSANGRYTFLAVVGTIGQSGIAVIDNRTAVVLRTYLLPGVADPHGVFFEPSRRA